ncbi:hypothetical protein L1987_49084 [Smallanthus sonchifolius]|uniref:Uncharacterized protein n=1 Tax=Smallanthus sonchifolius TaxID=185202 RepID=A0ACB9FUM6_9ASTR|nr:hypothetical protein L1987_49084 [Smallanthus sonchifolius]
MASILRFSIGLLLITVINTVAVTAVPDREIYSLLSALRNRGYNVFANAITTTDLHYDITSGGNFTFFTPTDSVLYTLDMRMSAGDYTTTLRFHVVPHRLSLSDLRNLPYGLTSFSTLLRDHEIHVVNPLSLPLPITVEGVGIAVPDLYYDTHIVVHGLESIIDFRSRNDTLNSTSIGEDLTPMDVRREAYAPAPQFVVPAANTPPQSSIVTGIDTVAYPKPVPRTSYVPSPDASQAQQRRQPETKSESIIQSHQSPETKSESIIQSHQLPETRSESIIQSQKSTEIYFQSTTQPLEEHVSIATRSEFVPQKIHHVSLATKSTGNANAAEEFTQVDDMIIDCPITDDDREQLSIANVRRGDVYMRELYTPTKMTCAHE